jgi:uncharacterized membrane protein
MTTSAVTVSPLGRPGLVLLAIVALAALVRFYRIGEDSFWLDEAFTYASSRFSWRVLFFQVPTWDKHLPLFYALVKAWSVFGDGEGAIRSLAALFGIATIPFAYGIGRLVAADGREAETGLVAAMFLALAPTQIQYAQEARAYSAMAFALTAAIWGVAWIMRHPNAGDSRRVWTFAAWTALVLGCALSVWFHNTSAIPVSVLGAVALAWLAIDRRWRKDIALRACIAFVAIAVLLVPAVSTVLDQARSVADGFWIPSPTLRSVMECLDEALVAPIGGGPMALLLFLAAAALGAFRIVLARGWALGVLLPAMLVVSFALELAISLVLAPILIPRVLVWMGPSIAVLLASAVSLVESGAMRAYAAIALTVVLATGTAAYHVAFVKQPWREFVGIVTSNGTPRDTIVAVPGYAAPLVYYLRHAASPPTVIKIPFDPKSAPPHFDERRDDADAFRALVADGASAHPNVWLFKQGESNVAEDALFRYVLSTLEASGRRVTGKWVGESLRLYRLQ